MRRLSAASRPGITSTGQGSRFTSTEFIEALTSCHIRVSRGDQEGWSDNFFVECLWLTVKYEEVYLKAHNSVREVCESIR